MLQRKTQDARRARLQRPPWTLDTHRRPIEPTCGKQSRCAQLGRFGSTAGKSKLNKLQDARHARLAWTLGAHRRLIEPKRGKQGRRTQLRLQRKDANTRRARLLWTVDSSTTHRAKSRHGKAAAAAHRCKTRKATVALDLPVAAAAQATRLSLPPALTARAMSQSICCPVASDARLLRELISRVATRALTNRTLAMPRLAAYGICGI